MFDGIVGRDIERPRTNPCFRVTRLVILGWRKKCSDVRTNFKEINCGTILWPLIAVLGQFPKLPGPASGKTLPS